MAEVEQTPGHIELQSPFPSRKHQLFVDEPQDCVVFEIDIGGEALSPEKDAGFAKACCEIRGIMGIPQSKLRWC